MTTGLNLWARAPPRLQSCLLTGAIRAEIRVQSRRAHRPHRWAIQVWSMPWLRCHTHPPRAMKPSRNCHELPFRTQMKKSKSSRMIMTTRKLKKIMLHHREHLHRLKTITQMRKIRNNVSKALSRRGRQGGRWSLCCRALWAQARSCLTNRARLLWWEKTRRRCLQSLSQDTGIQLELRGSQLTNQLLKGH